MGVMMLIGLFTYRVILRTLGVTDYGVYSAVGGVVTLFMLVMNTVSSAISRYITVGLGKGDAARLKTVFWTSVLVMAGFCAIIALFTETAGLWYLHNKMVIPPGRADAAAVVLQTSLIVLAVNLLSVPFTSVITAHEHMDAYAWISILEAVLKLAVAFGVWLSPADKLVTYAWLLVAVALVNRGAYVLYARAKFPETRGPLRFDAALVREMGGFAGWNFLGSGSYMLGTQGVNQLMNIFFGVGMNAARGVADKVESVVRQFATNIALALNPQLTKSYVSGNREYTFELACKGSKYYMWILWVLAVPFLVDADAILNLWIGRVPENAALFTKLTLWCFIIDFTPNTLVIIEQAYGRIKGFYLLTTAVTVLVFPITWILYRLGAPAYVGYLVFFVLYLIKGAVVILKVGRDTGFPVRKYLRRGILPAALPVLIMLPVLVLLSECIPPSNWRILISILADVVLSAAVTWFTGLTEGEKAFVSSKLPWRQK